jgi:hypothetical protein
MARALTNLRVTPATVVLERVKANLPWKSQKRTKNIRQKIKPVTRKNQGLLQDCRQSSGYSKGILLAGRLAVSLVD